MRYRRTLRYEPLENRRLLATLTVTTLADTVDLTDGLTSLREAIFATNLVTGPDIIEFSSKLPGIVTLTQGELRITDDLTIRHQGGLITLDALASDPTPAVNNGDGSRIFHVDDGSSARFIEVVIEGLALVGGDAPLSGGAILNRENLTLSRMHAIGNSASNGDITILSNGGGIAHSLGRLVVTDSEIAKNAADFGGGIHVESGTLLINRSIIAMNSSVSGSGIYIAAGEAAVANSWITGNSAGAFSLGGGIYNSSNLRVEATTISGNSASFGAGIFSRTDGSDATRITNSTISVNTAFDRGGGVRNAAGLTIIEHSTVTGNTAPPGDGGGVATRGYDNSRTEIVSTIIAGNTNSDVDFGTGDLNTFVSLGFNLIGTGNAIAEFNAAGDRNGIADPLLGPLADNGGPTLPGGTTLLTHAILPGSPAINAGDLTSKAGADVPLYDQRGAPFARVVNGRIDIGAYEFQEASDLNLLVDTLEDESDGNFAIGDLSLREAIELTNQWPSADTIRFDPDLTAAGPATILLTKGELKINDDLTIEGRGADLLTINASGNDPTPGVPDGKGSRVFTVDEGTNNSLDVLLNGLQLIGGDVDVQGGAVFSRENVTLRGAIVSGNSADAGGGGISSYGGLTVIESTIALNAARGGKGGGIRAYGVSTIANSALSGNHALFGGGFHSSGKFNLTGSTVYGNSADHSGGGLSNYADSKIEDTTITNNSAPIGGGVLSYARLRIEDATITGNSAAMSGGGIRGVGSVVLLVSTTVCGNWAGAEGGGMSLISNNAVLNWSSVIGNTSGGEGGGVWCRFSGIFIAASTIGFNTASTFGGGIFAQDADVSSWSSTVSSNTAGRNGGGLYLAGRVDKQYDFRNSTIAANTAETIGGGLFAARGMVILDHTLVARNTAVFGPDLTGLFDLEITSKYSLIGNNADSGLSATEPGVADKNGNLIGPAEAPIDPRIGPLTANGGLTLTHALFQGSPAIDAGDPVGKFVEPTDQRLAPFVRVFDGDGKGGARIDIGAFELQPNPTPFAGDYNFDGVVDASDYVQWRSLVGSTDDLRADGNGDGVVDDADRLVWRANFGRIAGSVGQSAGSMEFESNAVAPKPPASPAGDLGAASEPRADTSFTTVRRRALGSRLVEAVSLNSVTQSEDSVLAVLLVLRRTSDDEWSDFSPRRDNSRGLESDVSDARAAVLDCVFDAIGAW